MCDELQRKLISYYDERAQEYDEIYSGKSPLIQEPDLYQKDVKRIAGIISTFGTGHVVDIGCGTGFWLPYYAGNASRITLIDESENMLNICRRRIKALEIADKCEIHRENFFRKTFGNNRFDSVIIGFFVSHIPPKHEELFFTRLKTLLKPYAQVLFIDSVWSKERRPHRKKSGIQERTLNNGRTFKIFKRYFTLPDVEAMFERHGFTLLSSYMGNVFLAATGEKNG